MGVEIYGRAHLTYEVISILVMFFTLYVIYKFVDKKNYTNVVKLFALLNLIVAFINRFSYAGYTIFDVHIVPDSFCSLSAILGSVSLLVLPKNSKFFAFIIPAGFFGGLLTNIYPDFIMNFDSIMNVTCLSGLIYHSGMVFLLALTIMTKYYIPKLDNSLMFILGSIFYFFWALFIDFGLGLSEADDMYLLHPVLDGTIFYWYVVLFLMFIIYIFILVCYERVKMDNEQRIDVSVYSMIINSFKLRNLFK